MRAQGAAPATRARAHSHGPGGHTHAEPAQILGAVPVLDIGDGVGAIVALLAAATTTGELFAEPVGDEGAWFHTGVHARHLDGAHVHVAVFPEVQEGRYNVLRDDGSIWRTVEVTGGAVTELDLR